MLAFTRKPSDDESPVPVELLLNDADDDLAPLASPAVITEERPLSVDLADIRDTRLVVAPAWTERERASYMALLQFASSQEPRFGWRHLLFVVSGICLMPSRSERVFREYVDVLVRSVDPAILDDEKEAAS